MKILIVEDEELAVEKLRYTIASIEENAEITGCTGSISETVDWLLQHPEPDMILMDIELSDGQSFEIFKQVDVQSRVIFTTSYDEYALKAFKVNSIDYLLKPVQKDDLRAAFDKYKRLTAGAVPLPGGGQEINIKSLLQELHRQFQPRDYRPRFLVKQGHKHLPVETDRIAYFFVDDRIICFKTKDNKKYVVDYTMDEIEAQIDPARFFRINRSFILSVESISQLHDYTNSRLVLKLNPEISKEVIVSREKVVDFKNWMGK
ncbi:MAG: response regulator transcription factor [Williamsia sp.]|nr:response regulator transcription factor [Williamsia sp.]